MRIDDLASHGHADPSVAGEASIRVGGRLGEMLRAIAVAADAEVRLLDRPEIEAVFVVVTGRAQTTAHRPG